MAEPITNPQRLSEVLDSIYQDLTSNHITLEDALILASHYPSLRMLMEQNAPKIALVLRSGITATEKKSLLAILFGDQRVNALLESKELPDVQISETDIRYKSQQLANVRKQAYEKAASLALEKKEKAHAFATELSRAYCKRATSGLPAQESARISNAVDSAVASAIASDKLPDNIHGFVQSTVKEAIRPAGKTISEDAVKEVLAETKHLDEGIELTRTKLAVAGRIPEELVRHAGRVDLSLLTRFVEIEELTGAANPIDQAVRMTKATQVLNLPKSQVESLMRSGVDIGTILSKAGITNLSGLNPPVQQALVDESFWLLLDRLDRKDPLSVLDALTRKLGPDAAEKLAPFIQRANALYGVGGATPKSISASAAGIVTDLGSAFFGTSDAMAAYMKAAYHGLLSESQVGLMTKDHFFLAAISAQSDALYPEFSGGGDMLMQWLGEAGAKIGRGGPGGTAAGGVTAGLGVGATEAASRGFLARLAMWGAANTGFKAAAAQGLAKLGLVIFGVASGPPGWLLATGTLFSGVISKGLGKLFSGEVGPWAAATTGAPTAILGGFGVQEKKEKMNWWLLGGVGAVLVVLFFIGLPLLVIPGVKGGAQVMSLAGGGPSPGEGSRLIQLTKKASPNAFPNNDPTSITYTISVEPTYTGEVLTITSISDDFSVFGKSNPKTPQAPDIQFVDESGIKKFSFTVSLGDEYKDSIIINTLRITADVGDKKGETKTISTAVIIGNPPTSCFSLEDSGKDLDGYAASPWTAQEKKKMYTAIVEISKHERYRNSLCGGGTIDVYRIHREHGGGVAWGSGGKIYIYNIGVNTYTLAHESGHIYQARNTDVYDLFIESGIHSTEGTPHTYPKNGLQGLASEDFAETIALYIVPGKTDFPGLYPKHYKFAEEEIF